MATIHDYPHGTRLLVMSAYNGDPEEVIVQEHTKSGYTKVSFFCESGPTKWFKPGLGLHVIEQLLP